MMTTEALIGHIEKYFFQIEKISDQVIRAIRQYKGNPYQIFYFDLSGAITYQELGSYLKKYIADDYFASPGPMQWNFYVVFLIDHDVSFSEQAAIESDLDFARKFLLRSDELPHWLQRTYRSFKEEIDNEIEISLSEIWRLELKKYNLGFLAERSIPVESGIDKIITGDLSNEYDPSHFDDDFEDHDLAIGEIEWIDPIIYREYPKSEKPFQFRKVNLINGANGHGKTSLLEAIEYSLTGENSRSENDSSKNPYTIKLKFKGNPRTSFSTNERSILIKREGSWYNSNHIESRSSLASNFSKFNYYNTDASFRLAFNKHEQDLEIAFRDLALGEETNKSRIHLENYKEKLNYQLLSREQLLVEYKKELDEASDMINRVSRSEIDYQGLLADLARQISTTGITFNQYNPDFPNVEEIRLFLKEFTSDLNGLLKSVDWLPEVSFKNIISEFELLNSTYDDINDLNGKIKNANEQKKMLESKRIRSIQQIELLKTYSRVMRLDVTWDTFYDENFSAEDTDQINNFQTDLKLKFKIYKSLGKKRLSIINDYVRISQQRDLESKHHDVKITALEDDLQTRQFRLRREQTDIGIAIARARERLNDFNSVFTKLSDYINHYLALNPTSCRCPTCKTNFESLADLKEAVAADLNFVDEVNRIAGLRQEELKINRALFDIAYAFDRIWTLKNIARKKIYRLTHIIETETLGNAIKKIRSKIIGRLNLSEEEIREISDIIIWAEDPKNDFSRLEYIEVALSKNFPPDVLKSAVKTNKMILHLEKQIEDWSKAIYKLRASIDNLMRSRYSLINNIIPISLERDEKKITNQLFERRDRLNIYAKGVVRNSALTFDLTNNPSELLKKTERLFEFVDQLCYELTLSQKSTSLSQQALETLKNRTPVVEKTELEIDRIKFALAVIEVIDDNHNEADYLSKFMRSNRERIKNIFVTIHAPKEFNDITIKDGKLFLEKINGDISDLNTISTGQRSALAISIFIALNNKVRSGPPLILFDDPLAFTDDLNILSFLDYIREMTMSISGGKQLFFATANENLAFLFKKKFEVFANDFRTIDLKR